MHNVETLPSENILSAMTQQFDTVKEDIAEIEAMAAELRGSETEAREILEESEVIDALSDNVVK